MTSEVEEINLFPIKVCKTKCEHHEIIKKFVLDSVYDHFVEHGPNSTPGDSYTDYVPGAKQIFWNHLYGFYNKPVKRLLTSIGIPEIDKWQVKLKGWYNLTTNKPSLNIHEHVGGPSTISFAVVHYLELGDDGMSTIFMNPNRDKLKLISPTKDLSYLPEYFLYNYEKIEVEEGDMVIFPAWFAHSMPVHTNGTLRASNALNVMLRIDNSDGM
jgi:hypothetical protein